MAIDVLTETVIARPRAEVAAFAVDPNRVPLWYTNIKAIEWQNEPPLVVGSRVAFVAEFLRRRLAYTYEVVEHVPGERFVMRSVEGPFPMETSYTWESTPEGHTRMGLRNRGEPRGFSVFVAPFMRLAIRRQTSRDLALLKAILERRAGRPRVA